MSRKFAAMALAFVASLSVQSTLSAQPFEEVFGPKDSVDVGQRRVTPVTQCPDRGYIAIGTRNLNFVSQVYVVRTDNSGATIWEHYYDVGFDGRPDEGYALVELRDGSGFITTGTSNRGGQWAAHALKIDCDGRPRFSFFYLPITTAPLRVVGHDIREAFSGDGISTNAGDLLIAGYLEDPSLRSDAFLMRINNAGNVIWHRRYETGVDERFFGLTEARPTVSPTGDIVAVGEYDTLLGSQALVMRLDGNNGGFTAFNHCAAAYGDVGEENFKSVVEVQTAPDTGALTMAGLSTSPGMQEDLYLVQTKDNPCNVLAQVTIGNEFGIPYSEFANDLIEVLTPVDPGLGVPVGSFALTGSAEGGGTRADAFLLFVKPSSLAPLAARRYGDHGGFVDFGVSLAQNGPFGPQPPGFVIAGTSQTDWDGSADPSDLYLIQPTDSGKTGCEKEWFPDGLEWPWDPRRLDVRITKPIHEVPVHTDVWRDDTRVVVCP